MRLAISQEKGPIGRKCEHWASFLSTRNRLSNTRENPLPGGYGLSLLILAAISLSRHKGVLITPPSLTVWYLAAFAINGFLTTLSVY